MAAALNQLAGSTSFVSGVLKRKTKTCPQMCPLRARAMTTWFKILQRFLLAIDRDHASECSTSPDDAARTSVSSE